MPTLSKKELDAIIDEVATALNGAAVVEAAKLSKAAGGEDTSAEVPSDDSSTPTPDASASSSPAPSDSAPATDGPPPADASASPSADPSAAPSADPSAPAPDAGGQGVDPRELEAAYAALPIEELKMHFMACKCAFTAAMGNDPSAADPSAQAPGPDAGAAPGPGADAGMAPPPGPDAAGSPPPGPDAGSPPPPADDNAPALKAEMGTEIPHDTKADGENPLDSVKKSEKEKAIASLGVPRKTATDEAIVSLSKSDHDKLINAIKNFVEQPVRKSITSTSQVPRPTGDVNVESLTKNEVLTRLKKVATKPTLTKDDRVAINSYALDLVKIDAVKHLLTP